MKCICGYEYKWEYVEVEDFGKCARATIGDDAFFSIEGTFFKTLKEPWRQRDYIEKAYLYACPKCGTIKLG